MSSPIQQNVLPNLPKLVRNYSERPLHAKADAKAVTTSADGTLVFLALDGRMIEVWSTSSIESAALDEEKSDAGYWRVGYFKCYGHAWYVF